MEELLLWRWSTAVQISSALIIAAFFVAYYRELAQPALRLWTAAWVANALALLVTWGFWLLQPDGVLARQLTTGLYTATKTGFVLLVVSGLRVHLGSGRPLLPSAAGFAALGLLGIGSAIVLVDIDRIGTAQSALIAAVFGYGAWLCWRHPGQGLGWLGFGLALRALLAALEMLAYASRLILPEQAEPPYVDLFLAAHSSFDTGAEWVIALGCVLALGHRVLNELTQSHAELHAAHTELQRIAERDALTGLYNRRMLNTLLEAPAVRDGSLLFFDLDDFKRINDAYGHDVGDESLCRFAAALADAFPEASGLVRFAGDEFVVLLPAGAATDTQARIEALRARLQGDATGRPPIDFSTGSVPVGATHDLRALLHAADLAMYRDKRERAGQRRESWPRTAE